MKITVSSMGRTVTIEDRDDMTLSEFRDDVLVPLLLGMGYHQDNVKELFFDEEAVPPLEIGS